jgi:DNA-binding TFAR19-related protein (PDSD5 family)
MINSLSYSQPTVALQWAGALSDAAQREQRMESVARNRIYNDETAARQWISQSALSAEAKERLGRIRMQRGN